MASTFEIPKSPTPSSNSIQFPNGVTYTLSFQYLFVVENPIWIMDISDANANPIACGIPLITGADLLAQLQYLGFDCSMFATTDGDPTAPPTFYNLGTAGHLRISTPAGA
jgi:hypothetical protein